MQICPRKSELSQNMQLIVTKMINLRDTAGSTLFNLIKTSIAATSDIICVQFDHTLFNSKIVPLLRSVHQLNHYKCKIRSVHESHKLI